MQHRNKAGRPGYWRALLALLALALTAAACKDNSVTGIGVGLPSAQTNTGAYLIDTITVRAFTVLRDSVVTSGSPYLLVGQTTDPLLGRLTAKSYFQLSVPGDNFKIDPSYRYDSLVLVLPSEKYRYGDTTKTQALVEVHQLTTPISETKASYASPNITPVLYGPVLNKGGVAPVRRARLNSGTLRLRLDDQTFGPALLTAGQSGLYQTQDLFTTYLPGLALTPAASDDAAILRLSVASANLVLYYHDPTVPGTALSFSLGVNRRFFQMETVRNGIPGLPTPAQRVVSSSATGERTFIEGVLGLQTKLEFPYLSDLSAFGNNLTVTNAQITAYVPSTTISPYVPTPPSIVVSGANTQSQPVGTYVASVPYQTAISPLTGLDQGTYNWEVTTYVRAVLNHTLANNGLLLSSATNDLPSRVVLGSPRLATADKLKMRVYLIQVQ